MSKTTMAKIIYLDNASTTNVDEEILKSFEEVILKHNGNSSSIHQIGMDASLLLEKARKQILNLLSIENTHQAIFTSGATESNNLAIKGVAFQYKNRGKHLITSKIEHPSVLNAFKQLEECFGYEVTYLPVYEDGRIRIDDLLKSIRKDTILVSLMAVNNETGSIQPINEVADILVKYPTIYFHCDAVQAIGKINLPYQKIDLLTFTSHKIHGLKGTGCLIKTNSISLLPLNSGGDQEEGQRSGTVDVAGAACLSKALRLALNNQESTKNHIEKLASKLVDYLKNNRDTYHLNSNIDEFPYIVNFSLLNKKAAVVVEALSRRGIMVSSVSACHSKREKSSYVLQEMYHDDNLAHNPIRVSFSKENTIDEVETLIHELDAIVKGLRQ